MTIMWGQETGFGRERKAHVAVDAHALIGPPGRDVRGQPVRIGTRWQTLCHVELRHFFGDRVPQIRWLSPWDQSLEQDPDVLCVRCWYRAFRLASGSQLSERDFIRIVRNGSVVGLLS